MGVILATSMAFGLWLLIVERLTIDRVSFVIAFAIALSLPPLLAVYFGRRSRLNRK